MLQRRCLPLARAGKRRRWFPSEPPGFSRGEIQTPTPRYTVARSTWKCQLLEAVALLDELLSRMQAYQHKKTPRLRALYSWQ
jgi:hypothetical protein